VSYSKWLVALLVGVLSAAKTVAEGAKVSVPLSDQQQGLLTLLTPTTEQFTLWDDKSFEGWTKYSLEVDDQGAGYVRANSDASASGLFLKQQINISEYPFLNWEWRVDQGLSGVDERSKAGDDYAARMYVVVDGGLFFWKTIALNYVWSSNEKAGATWDNAFAGSNARMLALKDATTSKQHWYQEKRNVRDDFKRQFGRDIAMIDAVAIMTDTDNGGSVASAAYRNVYFSKE